MNSDINLSLVMIVKNEERCLARCLESVKTLVDEMIIVDTGSTDKTIDIAKSYGAKIFHFEWTNDFSEARNFALSKASGKWRLVLDADEYVVEGNREALEKQLKKQHIGLVERIDAFNKTGEIQYSRTYIARILPKEVVYQGKIHEQIIGEKYIRMPLCLEHDGYLYQDKADRNLEILFNTCKDEPKNAYMQFQLAHTLYLAERTKEALEHFEVFYSLCPSKQSYRAVAVVDYLYCLIDEKRFEQAIKVIENEKEKYMDYPDFHLASASFYREFVLNDIKKNIKYLPLIEEEYLRCLDLGETDKYDSIEGSGTYIAAYNLGVWYEVTKQNEKAVICYNMADEWGYEKAKERLKVLGQ